MFDLLYELDEAGWANTTFKWEGGTFVLRHEYLADPLGDLAKQARWFVDPRRRADIDAPKAYFCDAPRNIHLVIEEDSFQWPVGHDEWNDLKDQRFQLTLTHDLDFDLDKDNPSEPLPLGEIAANEYVAILYRELNQIWEAYGMIGYRERWLMHDFPLEDFIMVGQLLDMPPPNRPLWG